jgi:hypothetical protein
MSSNGNAQAVSRILSSGAAEYLVKPVSKAQLATLHRFIVDFKPPVPTPSTATHTDTLLAPHAATVTPALEASIFAPAHAAPPRRASFDHNSASDVSQGTASKCFVCSVDMDASHGREATPPKVKPSAPRACAAPVLASVGESHHGCHTGPPRVRREGLCLEGQRAAMQLMLAAQESVSSVCPVSIMQVQLALLCACQASTFQGHSLLSAGMEPYPG